MTDNDIGMVRCKEDLMRGLEACQKADCYHCPYEDIGCSPVLAYDALLLLKEQDEGIAPIVSTTKQKEFADRIGLAVSDFWCGACHFNLIGHPKFCPNCGKAVKWDD